MPTKRCCCSATPGACPECDTFTSVVIDTVGNACSACQSLEGTYVVRTTGDPWIVSCFIYINALSPGTSCGGTIIGDFGAPNDPGILVTLFAVGSNVKCRIDVKVAYTDGVGAPTFQSLYQSTFEATVANCAALVGATFTFIGGVESVYLGTGVGDLCDMNSATVTLA